MEIGFNLSDAKVLAPSMETFDGFHRRGHIFHRPTIQRGSNTALIAVALIAAGSLVACSSGARSGSTTLAPSVSQSASSGSSLTLVALGDSIPFGGPTCDGCRSFVNLFADAMTSHIGTRVVARNLVVPGATSDDLLDQGCLGVVGSEFVSPIPPDRLIWSVLRNWPKMGLSWP